MDVSSIFQSYSRVAATSISASVTVQPVSLLDSNVRFCIRCVDTTREEMINQAIKNNPSLAHIVKNASAKEGLSTSQIQTGHALASAVASAADFLVLEGDGALKARLQSGLAYVDIATMRPVVNAMSQLLPSIAEQLGDPLTAAETCEWATIAGVLLQVLQRLDGQTMAVLAMPQHVMRGLQKALRAVYHFGVIESAFFFPQGGSEAEATERMELLNTMLNLVTESARQRVLWRAEADAQRQRNAASSANSSDSKKSKGKLAKWMT